ncbi:MAG: acyl-CoA dehydrogenase family protein [Actinobacteria bacterium]|nr:acyl-CoA dehydrogenase family protein [Actinomycetota bacterium]
MIDFKIPDELDRVRTRVAEFIDAEVLQQEGVLGEHHDEATFDKVVGELREKAREWGIYNPHLPAEFGGLGLGPLGMALVSQECGVSGLASLSLNCMAPDEGNMHLLLHAANAEQIERYLRPLAEGKTRSCFAMTEQAAGSDPLGIRTRAIKAGENWVINGEKWFITGADGAAFAIVVAQTEPDAQPPYAGYTLFLVDSDNPGWNVIRQIPTMGTEGPGGHCEVRITDCVVSGDSILGGEGMGYALAQTRLGPARLAHAMRWIGMAQRALDLAAKRALERETFGSPLSDKQAVQWMIADSAMELYASRLMVLHAAYLIENQQDFRQEVGFAKVFIAESLNNIVDRALQIHGSLGYSTDLPLERFYRDARAARIYDGPSEVHRASIARRVLKAQKRFGTTKSATGGLA